MDADKILKLAGLFEQAATKKHHGYGLVDEPTAGPEFRMWKVIGLDENGEEIIANVYANSKEEAKSNFEMIYEGSRVLEVKLAKDLLK
jgi:hypothetical protein